MKSFLLDTHTLLWMQDDNSSLSEKARKILENKNSILHVSIVSFWEITIKQSLGKLKLNYTINELLETCILSGIIVVPIQISALNIIAKLPFIHRDPFDRIIIPTSIDMDCTLISKDASFRQYDLKCLW